MRFYLVLLAGLVRIVNELNKMLIFLENNTFTYCVIECYIHRHCTEKSAQWQKMCDFRWLHYWCCRREPTDHEIFLRTASFMRIVCRKNLSICRFLPPSTIHYSPYKKQQLNRCILYFWIMKYINSSNFFYFFIFRCNYFWSSHRIDIMYYF